MWCMPALNGRLFGSCNILMQTSLFSKFTAGTEENTGWNSNQRHISYEAETLTNTTRISRQWISVLSVFFHRFHTHCESRIHESGLRCSAFHWRRVWFLSVGETFFVHCVVQRGLLGCGLVGITDRLDGIFEIVPEIERRQYLYWRRLLCKNNVMYSKYYSY